MKYVKRCCWEICLYFPQDTKGESMCLVDLTSDHVKTKYNRIWVSAAVNRGLWGKNMDMPCCYCRELSLINFISGITLYGGVNTHYRMGFVHLWSWQYHKPLNVTVQRRLCYYLHFHVKTNKTKLSLAYYQWWFIWLWWFSMDGHCCWFFFLRKL